LTKEEKYNFREQIQPKTKNIGLTQQHYWFS